MIERAASVRRKDDLLDYEMDGETVMMSIEQGAYYALDRIGGRIWELIAEPASVSQVLEILTGEFEVDQETCEADTLAFLNELYSMGLIEVAGEARP